MASLIIAIGGHAQVVENDFGSSSKPKSSFSESAQSSNKPAKGFFANSSAAIDIRFPKTSESGWGHSLTYVAMDYLAFGWYNDYYHSPEGVANFKDWGITIGGNYRYWPAKNIFVEGQAGIGWYTMSFEAEAVLSVTGTQINTYKKLYSEDGFMFYITPRAGLKVYDASFGSIYATVGYRWESVNIDDYDSPHGLTIGLAAVF